MGALEHPPTVHCVRKGVRQGSSLKSDCVDDSRMMRIRLKASGNSLSPTSALPLLGRLGSSPLPREEIINRHGNTALWPSKSNTGPRLVRSLDPQKKVVFYALLRLIRTNPLAGEASIGVFTFCKISI